MTSTGEWHFVALSIEVDSATKYGKGRFFLDDKHGYRDAEEEDSDSYVSDSFFTKDKNKSP